MLIELPPDLLPLPLTRFLERDGVFTSRAHECDDNDSDDDAIRLAILRARHTLIHHISSAQVVALLSPQLLHCAVVPWMALMAAPLDAPIATIHARKWPTAADDLSLSLGAAAASSSLSRTSSVLDTLTLATCAFLHLPSSLISSNILHPTHFSLLPLSLSHAFI